MKRPQINPKPEENTQKYEQTRCIMVYVKMVNRGTTGSPSSKYEHRQASALLPNIRNIRICMGKKPSVSVTYENKRI